jgi:hypothetical protein
MLVQGARVCVRAVFVRARLTRTILAPVVDGAFVAVFAWGAVVYMIALSSPCIAKIIGAGIAVIAVLGLSANALPIYTGIVHGAWVSIVARSSNRLEHTTASANIADILGARVSVVAHSVVCLAVAVIVNAVACLWLWVWGIAFSDYASHAHAKSLACPKLVLLFARHLPLHLVCKPIAVVIESIADFFFRGLGVARGKPLHCASTLPVTCAELIGLEALR